MSGAIVLGLSHDRTENGNLELAALLARSSGRRLLVVCVVPDRWGPVGPGRAVDRDYHDFLLTQARESLDDASRHLRELGVDAAYDVVSGRSIPAGLIEAAEREGGEVLVAGSSDDGPWGHIHLGSVTDRLLHSAPLPVAVAPRGYRAARDRVGRVTVALDCTPGSAAVLERAARVATAVQARLRVVAFAVRGRTMYPPRVGVDIEDRVLQQWREDARETLERAAAALPEEVRGTPELVVADGRGWADTLCETGWEAGEVLVLGSSAHQPLLERVFLGSTATRILRHSPVPVVVVP